MAGTALAKRPQTARANPPRQATRVVVREVSAPPARRRRSSGGGGGGGFMGTGVTMQRGLVAYALGAAQRAGTFVRIPTIAQFGVEGTISVVAGMMSKGQGGLMADVALVSGLVSLNQLGREGITGTPRASVEGVGAAKRDPYEVQGDPEEAA